MKSGDKSPHSKGLTLAELLIVIAILCLLATLIVPALSNYLSDSRGDVTRQSLANLRDVIADAYWQDRVGLNSNNMNISVLPQPNSNKSPDRVIGGVVYPQMAFLFLNPNHQPPDTVSDYDPVYRVGWRGPYVVNSSGTYTVTGTGKTDFTTQYGLTGDPTVLDGWGRPIVIQCPGLALDGVGLDVRLVSAGPDGVINVDPTVSTAWLMHTVQPATTYISRSRCGHECAAKVSGTLRVPLAVGTPTRAAASGPVTDT